MNDLIKTLTDRGWNFTPCKEPRPVTNPRLAKAPDAFKEFVSRFDVLANESDTVWFLSLRDYETEPDDEAFAWNEFERECLECAEDDDEAAELTAFWDNVLPIAMSVDGQYSYLGLVLDGDDRGKVVFGCEPVYEETETLCNSFDELAELFARPVAEDSVLNIFI